MANRLAMNTVGNKWSLELDSDPSVGGGFQAPIGSEAMVNNGGVGSQWFKYGNGATDWRNVTDALGGYNVATYTTTQTLLITNDFVKCNASSGPFDINLPQANTCLGKLFNIKKSDSSYNVISIKTFSGDFIDQTSSEYLLELTGEFVSIISDGSGWNVISE
jgi:hypothetical protein